MAETWHTGFLTGEVVEVRFAYSGKVATVNKGAGERVQKGNILASLDKREQQLELEKELTDYERIRAEFEMFVLKVPSPSTDMEKYEKTQKQAMLNSAVKAVELVKLRMDNADLKSPISGSVISNSNIRAGMFVTPSSNIFEVLDEMTWKVEMKVEWDEVYKFSAGKNVRVKLESFEEEISGEIMEIGPGAKAAKPEKPVVNIKLEPNDKFMLGMPAKVYVPVGN